MECGENNWDVALVEKDGKIAAALPFFLKKKYGFTGIELPILAPFNGCYLVYPDNQKYSTRLAWEHRILGELIDALPKCDFYQQFFPPEFGNWLPFYWKGFQQSVRYTYFIQNIGDTVHVFDNFEGRARTAIRKAEKIATVESRSDPFFMHSFLEQTFARQNEKLPCSAAQLQRLMQFFNKMGAGWQLVAKNEKGKVMAAVIVVEDGDCAYNILRAGTESPESGNIMSLLIWEAIKQAASRGMECFDFSGSMIKGVENFIRSFGAVQRPYFHIWKDHSRTFRVLKSLKKILK